MHIKSLYPNIFFYKKSYYEKIKTIPTIKFMLEGKELYFKILS